MIYLKLAWRSLWRNRRRTVITTTSVAFAVILATTMRCLQLGSYDKMIENVVGYYTGYIQLQGKEYWKTRSLDEGFTYTDSLNSIILSIKEVESITPRLESYVLSGGETKTKVALVIGSDPENEDRVTKLSDKLVLGSYFNDSIPSVLLADGLAQALKLNLNDTVVILGQGYHGTSAAAKYTVSGIVHFNAPELNKQLIYLPLKEAQWLFGGDVITSVSLMLDKPQNMTAVAQQLTQTLGDLYEIKDWKDMMPDLDEAIKADNSGGLIMVSVLYIIIAFGIFGTLIMMFIERKREFGVLVSLGMKRIQLAVTIFIESISIGIMGTMAGFALSIPVVFWLHNHPIRFTGEAAKGFESYGFEPIMITSLDSSIFIAQGALVFILTSALSLYPFFKLLKLDALKAMRM